MAANSLVLIALMCLFGYALALHCFQCGLYNDGVGSITPCLNDSHVKLKECSKEQTFCIKYVIDSSTVRDCVPKCQEKEVWSAKTYCCNTDGCNGAELKEASIGFALLSAILPFFAAIH